MENSKLVRKYVKGRAASYVLAAGLVLAAALTLTGCDISEDTLRSIAGMIGQDAVEEALGAQDAGTTDDKKEEQSGSIERADDKEEQSGSIENAGDREEPGSAAGTASKYPSTWDVSRLYSGEEAFAKDCDVISAWIQNLSEYEGKLTNDAAVSEFYDFYWDETARDVYGKMMTYVNMCLTMDSSDETAKKLDGMLSVLDADFIKATAFAEEEIQVPYENTADGRSNSGNKTDGSSGSENTADGRGEDSSRVHSADAASLMASVNAASGYGLKAYNAFCANDFPAGAFTLPDGRTVALNYANRTYIVNSPDYDRTVKINADAAYYDNLASCGDIYALFLEDTIAHNKVKADYAGCASIKEYFLEGTSRRAAEEAGIELNVSDEEAADPEDMAETDKSANRNADKNADENAEYIYDMVIDSLEMAIPSIKKDIDVKKAAIGEDVLYSFEYNAGTSDYEGVIFTYDEAIDLIRAALAPLGEEYMDNYDDYVAGGYIYADTAGSGRVSYTNLDSVKQEPYIYMEYYGDFTDVLTLAHEIGHAINYRFAKEGVSQRDFAVNELVSEIAPAVNELLVLRYMIDNAAEDSERLYYTEKLLAALNSKMITQAIYAQLEDYAVSAYVSGGHLSAAELDSKELNLKAKYYGDSYVSYPFWENIPHLHYGYYLYTYPASMEYALAITSRMLAGNEECRLIEETLDDKSAESSDEKASGSMTEKEYLGFLGTAGDDVFAALSKAGINPFDKAVYEDAMDYYEDIVEDYGKIT